MNRIPLVLCFALLAFFALVFVLPPGSIRGAPVIICVTPTPEGTIPGLDSDEIDFSVIKSVTQTTIYTVTNLENQSAGIFQEYFNTPDCSQSIGSSFDTLKQRSSKRYSLEDSRFPATFTGEIHIKSALRITSTSEIISKVTPPSVLYVPFVARNVPTSTPNQ